MPRYLLPGSLSQRARQLELYRTQAEAIAEWQKMFGDDFPSA